MHRSASKMVALCLGVVLLLVVLHFGWWVVFADSTNRSGQVRRQSFEYQQGRINQSLHNVVEIRNMNSQIAIVDSTQASLIRSQRTALINDTCVMVNEVDESNRPTELKRFLSEECP